MSVRALSWAFDVQIDDPLAKLVLLAIANNHNEAHDIAWPSVAHLCHVTRASERTVRNKLAKLEEIGLMRRKYRGGRSTQYVLLIDTPARDAPLHQMQDTPARDAPITYKEPEKKNKRAKIKIKDWSPTEADEAYARSKGHDPAKIIEGIRLWDDANGNVAGYVNPSAFYRQWVNREKPPRRPVVQAPVNANKHEDNARYYLTPRANGVRPWDEMTPSMQQDRRHNNPVLDRILKNSGD